MTNSELPPINHESTAVERAALRICAWAERWIPDAFVFAALATVLVAAATIWLGASFETASTSFAVGFWNESIFRFMTQMCFVIMGGYVVANSPPIARLIDALAMFPRTGRGAILLVALVSTTMSLVHWALSMILASLLVRALARRTNLDLDYRAAAAASYVGIGSVFAMGLSSSAAQMQANPKSAGPVLMAITGVIPFEQTIFLWQSIATTLIMIAAALAVAWFTAPQGSRAVTAAQLGINVDRMTTPLPANRRPGEWLEYSPLISLAIAGLGGFWLYREFVDAIDREGAKGAISTISSLNTYNFLFLMAGMLLCWRPRTFLDCVARSGGSVTGVLIQFPFYGGIAALITLPLDGGEHSIASYLAKFFTEHATHDTFPAIIGIYSAVLGFFVPSAGGKWIIEAPYVMQAAKDLEVHLGWTVQAYNAAETLPNLINPFWMLPVLGILGLKPRDVVGFTIMQFAVLLPLVLLLLWGFGRTLEYVAP